MPPPEHLLSVTDHRRDVSGMDYVYPVVSRRSGGVSVGINLNPNNACNWRCIYCQVPGLTRGGPPPINLRRLEDELRRMLGDIVHGRFMAEHVDSGVRVLTDIAFSGNGEPTSAPEFADAVALAARLRGEFGLDERVVLRLITNGSLMDRSRARAGVRALGAAGGEVWFKIDAATPAAMQRVNGSRQRPEAVLRRLRACADLCPTWVQSCFFAFDGAPPDAVEMAAYVDLLAAARDALAGVHLYGIARASHQLEAPRLARLPAEWWEPLAGRLRKLGLTVKVSP